MNISDRVKSFGHSLPEVSSPGGNYVSVNKRGVIAYVAIQFPILNGKFLYQGKFGASISDDDGMKAMELCALNVIAQIDSKIGFDAIEGLNHFDAYYQSIAEWDNAPVVVNGASDLFVNVLEEKGQHSRAIFGVDRLPRNFCVGLTASFTLKG
ncbi:RidA family protein [Ekhidna sp.]|uniref:RidA family protein n=1 Tax=Ekhidna sp. TaxID=2608089 RepID=UPI003C7A21AF